MLLSLDRSPIPNSDGSWGMPPRFPVWKLVSSSLLCPEIASAVYLHPAQMSLILW